MDSGLMLAALSWGSLWSILMVCVGLGMVIFVHELGHFAVAKWCGVKCEKFYLGFDIFGLKICKFRYGETEYGIGILPLGGYVKMLGQEDNPGKAVEEQQRAQSEGGVDPRSYIAKSVPQRMAIISAGVIMNLIFAFVVATIAFRLGVNRLPATIGHVVPGDVAWQLDLRPGDRVLQIDDQQHPLFEDLTELVTFGDLESGLLFTIQRAGATEPMKILVKPDGSDSRIASHLRPTIGITSPQSLEILSALDGAAITTPASAAARAEPSLRGGDVVQAINGVPVHTQTDLELQLLRHAREPITLQVQRPVEGQSPQQIEADLPAQARRWLGLVMTAGPISAVQANSPAAGKLQAGDELVAIDGSPPGDPLTLAQRLQELAGATVQVVVRRNGAELPPIEIALREVDRAEPCVTAGSAVSVNALGVAFPVLAVVAEIPADGPAAAVAATTAGAALQAGVAIEQAVVRYPAAAVEAQLVAGAESEPLAFGENKANWAFLMEELQQAPEGTSVALKLADGGEVVVPLAVQEGFFQYDRGLIFRPQYVFVQAPSLAAAVPLGLHESRDAVLMVYKFLRRLTSGQVSWKATGSLISIFQGAKSSADRGLGELLIFLCMLSANLAVINFLPIPVLDGGHMVFLTIEGIRRKPVSERVVLAFHYAGFLFLMTLMIIVLLLDLNVIKRFS